MKTLRFVAPTFLVAIVAACGGSLHTVGSDKDPDSGVEGGGGGPCASDTDCDADSLCGFPTAAACNAKGTCFSVKNLATCAAFSPACACDGSAINAICTPFPSGYLSKPLLHAGRCDDRGIGGSEHSCATGADCDPGYSCMYAAADLCAAKGVCKYTSGVATCAAFKEGCACDGTQVNTICNPVEGYVFKPLAHDSPCNDAGH